MLNAIISKMILNALTKGQSGSNPSITANAYLALLTTMPSGDGNGAVEVDKTSMKGYARLQLGAAGTSKESLDGTAFFPSAGSAWSSDDNAYKVENQANMQMAAIEDGVDATATVVGFAICKTANGTLTTDMLAWGRLIDSTTQQPTSVTLTGGSVPIFYYNSTDEKGDFTLLLGSDETASAEE